MQEHISYWQDLTDKDFVIVFGPVADPKGVYGLAIVEANNEAVASGFGKNDPAIKANLGFKFEIFHMPQVITREKNNP
jgi:uncharacterized protein YciI